MYAFDATKIDVSTSIDANVLLASSSSRQCGLILCLLDIASLHTVDFLNEFSKWSLYYAKLPPVNQVIQEKSS